MEDKPNQKVMRGAGVAILALSLTVTAVTSTRETVPKEKRTVTSVEKNGIAGVATAMKEYELEAAEELKLNVSIERASVNVVTAALQQSEEPKKKEAVQEMAQEKKATAEKAISAEDKEWQDKLMADVDDFLYVRAEADSDSEIVGKMYKGHRALVKDQGEKWTLIESGSVKGYVKNEYCVIGEKALKYAKKHCDKIVVVETDSLRVRSEADEEADIVKVVGKGEELTADADAEEVDGWIAVEVDKETCYVSAEFVTVRFDTGKAITIEEELAAIRAAEEAEAAAKAAKSPAGGSSRPSSGDQSGGSSSGRGPSLAATADEETLLAALVECEAGGCGVECMTAVGAVVINRVRSGSFPNSIYGVIYQSGQFGPASSGRLEQRLANGVSSSARQAARAALSGSDPTGGAKYFKLASSGHAGVVIGPIVFY